MRKNGSESGKERGSEKQEMGDGWRRKAQFIQNKKREREKRKRRKKKRDQKHKSGSNREKELGE